VTLSGAETVQERPLLSRKSKAQLSGCGVVHEVCIDHRGQLPRFSPLTVDVNWFRLTPEGLLGCQVMGNGPPFWGSGRVRVRVRIRNG